MDDKTKIKVEVAYALPEQQVIIPVQVEQGTTAEQAITVSGILQQFPDIDLASNAVGVFGKICKPDTVLRERDRVEIYRELIADPKDSRKRRADKKKAGEDDD